MNSTHTQYLVEIVTRDGGYNYHRPEETWHATVDTRAEADRIAADLEAVPNVVATVVYGWRCADPAIKLRHGSHGLKNCASGAKTERLATRLCEHQVCARGRDGMRLEKGAWVDATREQVMAACGLKA